MIFLVIMMILIMCFIQSYKKESSINRTIAFYNVENLFDTIDDPQTFDEDYTPSGKNKYSSQDYFHKIGNTAKVVSQIGNSMNCDAPVIVGLAEIENFQVLDHLIQSEVLSDNHYQIIHYNSPDQRGIDVALIYKKQMFQPIESEAIELRLWSEKGERIYTRDILYVRGILDNEEIHVFVNHWPSRRGGKSRSNPKRMKAAYLVKQKMEQILLVEPNAKIIILGDFNDDPKDKSIAFGLLKPSKTEIALSKFLFNPMQRMYNKGMNTLAYRDGINLFDQIIISNNLMTNNKNKKGFALHSAGIYNPSYLITQSGKYKGYPYRSFQNNAFSGGYSDHYPVFIKLKKTALP